MERVWAKEKNIHYGYKATVDKSIPIPFANLDD